MLKNAISLIVALLLCLSVCGCTDNSKKPNNGGQLGEDKMYITINDNKLDVALADNSAVAALMDILEQGDIVYTADDYGGFEKVGALGHTLPSNDSRITTTAGDVILYSSNQIVLFYGSNTWSYTRLGRIEGYSASELATLLGAGKGALQVTISLQ
ncbi:MAG: hypothetical protein J1G01_03425 [Clostridiales bacterium]|nr:hypothetical protein [Clostridiales bacterium]